MLKELLNKLPRKNHNLPAALKEEYGISISPLSTSLEELQSTGLRCLSAEEAARADSLLQFVPQMVVQKLNACNVQKAFDAAVGGSFKVSIAPGTHLAFSHGTPGAFRGIGLDNLTNKVGTGNPELFVNDAVLKVSSAPQIALSIFNVISFVTGQYFMAQINNKLATFTEGVNRIEQHLKIIEKSRIITAAQEIHDIERMVHYTEGNSSLIATIVQIHGIQRTAQETINTCRSIALEEVDLANQNDSEKEIQRKLATIEAQLFQYQYAIQVYVCATLVEAQVKKVSNPEEMKAFKSQMIERFNLYKEDLDKCETSIKEYLENNHAINGIKMCGEALKFIVNCSGIFIGKLGGIFTMSYGEEARKNVDAFIKEEAQKKKEDFATIFLDKFSLLKNMKAIEEIIQPVDNYIEVLSNGIELVKIGKDYYTNIPIASQAVSP